MSDPKSSGRSDPRQRPSIALPDAKEKAIDVLSECFAQDLVTLEDFERRVSLAHNARTMTDLGSSLSGIRTPGRPSGTGQEGSPTTLPRLASDLSPARIRPTDRAVAVFSETKRVGRWIPAQQNTVVAVMGSVEIDLREALLGPGESSFSVVTVMGSVEVIVPPNLHVECSGSAVLGSFEQHDPSPVLGGPDAPSIRIDGVAFLGSVDVEFRRIGESKREARRRRRREKKERRRLRSGR